MKKAQMLAHWRALPEQQKLKPCPVAYKHEGSTYSEDGIRITGSRAWIDSVLSRLKDLLAFEDCETRLQVTYQESKDRETQASLNSFNCYIQVHERGDEAKMINHFVSGIARKQTLVTAGY